MIVNKGLVVGEPWIDHILRAEKSWEMKSKPTRFRGLVALIRKGSGRISAVARITGCGPAQTTQQMVETFEKHRIPLAVINDPAVVKWRTPWMLADLRVLTQPIPYTHDSGGAWVNLWPDVTNAIAAQLGEDTSTRSDPPSLAGISPKPIMSLKPKGDAMPVPLPTIPGILLGETKLTAANLKHNHLYLTPFLARFPSDLIGGTNEDSLAPRQALVDWGGSTLVETDIPSDKKMFRRRGWVRQFLAENDAVPDDIVRVYQTAPYRYRVTIVKGAS